MNYEDTLVSYGAEVKALGSGKLGGHLVLFSNSSEPDISSTRDYFDAETDYGPHKSTLVYYHHGLDPKIGKRPLCEGSLKADDKGIWLEAQLNMRDEYEAAIYGMVEAGKLGLSSGTASHLVERESVGKAQHITRWPLGLDASLTPTPAEPRSRVLALKALIEADELKTAKEKLEAEPPEHPTGKTKSIDEGTLLAEATFADHAEAVLAAVKAFIDRQRAIIALRTDSRKAGRVLSEKNRARLADMCNQMETAVTEMRQMLEETAMPDPEAMQKALLGLRLEFLRNEARHREILAGV